MYATEWIRAGRQKKKSSIESVRSFSQLGQTDTIGSSSCLGHCVGAGSRAISEISSKECVDQLVASVVGAGKGGGSMAATYFSFLGREHPSFWKDQIKYPLLNTYYDVGTTLLTFIVSNPVHHWAPPHLAG